MMFPVCRPVHMYFYCNPFSWLDDGATRCGSRKTPVGAETVPDAAECHPKDARPFAQVRFYSTIMVSLALLFVSVSHLYPLLQLPVVSH